MAEKTKKKKSGPSRSGARRESYHHGQLREACIEAGVKLLDEKSMDFSLRDIARTLGVSHGAPYNHFKNKEHLLAAIATEGFVKFTMALSEAGEAASNDEVLFQQMGHAYVQFAVNHPHHYQLMFSPVLEDREQYEDLQEAGMAAFSQLIEMVEKLKSTGYFRDQPTMHLAITIWSTMHGFASLFLGSHMSAIEKTGMDQDVLFEGIHQTLMAGVVRSENVK